MGVRGPIPNREEDLARPRSRKGTDEQDAKKGLMRKVAVPRADPEWHPIAKQLYDSLRKSGQADFYQQSDWAYAYALCDDLSHYKNSSKRSAQMAQTLYAALGNLLVTEGDRRRVRIELQEPEVETTSASVLAIADYKKDLGV
ncbi:phage terminase small subunit [Streptomyces niveus]|uniref:phage terminase small subunit n=1 Tax=Streptomyces niveus TaxID=193462 RepID=UPI0035D9C5BA